MTDPVSSKSDAQPILPGATLGVFGGGQLGRMFALAAARLGYRVHVYSPYADCPAGQVASQQTVGDYADLDAVAQFAQDVDVVTLEFENVPTVATDAAARYAPVRPASHVLHLTQDRLREKRFLESAGIPGTPFAPVTSDAELDSVINKLGAPAVLKTTAWGYDGKGQARIDSADGAAAAWQSLNRQPAICEQWVDFQQELSVLVARSTTGEIAVYPLIANWHEHHILDLSVCPWPTLESVADEAGEMAETIATNLDAVGTLCVEFFLTTEGRLLVNEIAPRPHNSGHLTMDACGCSQFEQQVRAICGLPLGSTELVAPAAMANLLGHLWQKGEPPWEVSLLDPAVRLHLYGKAQAIAGRKMGHLTVLADTPQGAADRALAARNRLMGQSQPDATTLLVT
jgi:5-(carboxyamino)imidazole ribonucleotide synthase